MRPDAPFPKQNIVLTVITNKVQLIDLICEQLPSKIAYEGYTHKLVLTGCDPTPLEVKDGNFMLRGELKTTHEEAGVVMVQQMVHLAKKEGCVIKIICDDTDMFLLLLHHYYCNSLDCTVFMGDISAKQAIFQHWGNSLKAQRHNTRSVGCSCPDRMRHHCILVGCRELYSNKDTR